MSLCSGPQPRIGAVDVLRLSVQVQHVFPVALATYEVFVEQFSFCFFNHSTASSFRRLEK